MILCIHMLILLFFPFVSFPRHVCHEKLKLHQIEKKTPLFCLSTHAGKSPIFNMCVCVCVCVCVYFLPPQKNCLSKKLKIRGILSWIFRPIKSLSQFRGFVSVCLIAKSTCPRPSLPFPGGPAPHTEGAQTSSRRSNQPLKGELSKLQAGCAALPWVQHLLPSALLTWLGRGVSSHSAHTSLSLSAQTATLHFTESQSILYRLDLCILKNSFEDMSKQYEIFFSCRFSGCKYSCNKKDKNHFLYPSRSSSFLAYLQPIPQN